MSSFLFPSRTVTSLKVINVSLDVALRTIQDFPEMIRLDPLVLGFEAIASNPNLYRVKARTEVLGVPLSSRYTIKFTMVVDGLDIIWGSTLGTVYAVSWRARWAEGKTEITETSTVKAICFRLPFVMCDLRKSHEQLLDALTAKLEGQDPTLASRVVVDKQPNLGIITLFYASIAGIAIGLMYAGRTRTLETMLSFAAMAAMCSIYLIVMSAKPQDPYGTFHLALNKLPTDDDPHTEPKTEWLNMGFWRDTDIFPEACEALACKLIEAATVAEQDQVEFARTALRHP